MLGSFFWNPSREIIQIPFINLPLLWYGALFASGFAIGYLIFISILKRFLQYYPEYYLGDIVSNREISNKILNARSFFSISSDAQSKLGKREVLDFLNDSLDENYLGVDNDQIRLENRHSLDEKLSPHVLSLNKKPSIIADKILFYMVIATIIGSRLGHFLFYENPSDYFGDIMQIFRIRDGGHASHGAVLGILVAMVFFSRKVRKYLPQLDWLKALDLICIPASLGSAFIRIGNFFNQEILGKPSSLPWSVIFGSPADFSAPVPRHPVQLYEAGFYLVLFFILYLLSYNEKFLLKKGKLIGLFLISVFSFRFVIEFFKEDQSYFSQIFELNMGQLLSIPLVILGALFLIVKRKDNLYSDTVNS